MALLMLGFGDLKFLHRIWTRLQHQVSNWKIIMYSRRVPQHEHSYLPDDIKSEWECKKVLFDRHSHEVSHWMRNFFRKLWNNVAIILRKVFKISRQVANHRTEKNHQFENHPSYLVNGILECIQQKLILSIEGSIIFWVFLLVELIFIPMKNAMLICADMISEKLLTDRIVLLSDVPRDGVDEYRPGTSHPTDTCWEALFRKKS